MKYFLIIFLSWIFLFSCQKTNNEKIENIQKTNEKVSFCYYDAEILDGFSGFFSGDHCTHDGGWSAGLVVFLDENNQKIENFENISENASVHIFGLKKCENGEFLTEEEKWKTRHLIGKCSEQKCEFEENIENPWIILSPYQVKNNILFFSKSGKISEVVAWWQDCSEGL